VKCVKQLIAKENVQMMFRQETKKEVVNKELCCALWGNNDVQWEMTLSINAIGGLLCLWCKEAFKLNNTFRGNGFLGLEGIWREGRVENRDVTLVNIYLPCDMEWKRRLWRELKDKKGSSTNPTWCVMGDYNCVRRLGERVGINGEQHGGREDDKFNQFIRDGTC